MSKELVLSTKDLNEAGINSSLNQNDLVEIVAHEIFDGFSKSVSGVIAQGKKVEEKYHMLFDDEFQKMRADLVKGRMLTAKEDVQTKFSNTGKSWDGWIELQSLFLEEKDRGTYVKKRRLLSINFPKSPTDIKLTITVEEREVSVEKVINGISCNSNTIVNKAFTKVLAIPKDRYLDYIKEVKAFNQQVDQLLAILPESGLLSIEKFTREARVKMNKKIISAQSPDFKKKIQELFNIKL